MNAAQFVDHANHLADISRAILREEINQPRVVTVKSDATPVTPTDQKVERALRAAINEAYPEHGIVGEEYDDQHTDSDFVWVLDPIDGTMSFVAGLPTFCTLIALTWKGSPILGVMDSPITQERWVGADGFGSTLNGKTIQSRSCKALEHAIAQTSSPLYFESNTEIAAYDRMVNAVQFLIFGGGCQAFGRIADGYIDVAYETAHDIHDYLALVPIINNAGGVISDWQGNSLTLTSGSQFLASGDPALHKRAIEILNG
ncbi:MAG: inositol monophosphatase family protein [Granulosicoccaceae bacterium]